MNGRFPDQSCPAWLWPPHRRVMSRVATVKPSNAVAVQVQSMQRRWLDE